MTLAFMGAVTACVNDDFEEVVVNKTSTEKLALFPSVSDGEIRISTRAESIEALKENTLNTLDVFVEHINGESGEGEGSFIKQYHLPLKEGTPYTEQVKHLLANSWRKEGLKTGEYYNIYVAANTTLTHPATDITTVDALKGLIFNENEDGAIINQQGTFEWDDDVPRGLIYKKQIVGEEPTTYVDDKGQTNSYRFLTDQKEFMMDGVIKRWTPTETQDQEFDVTLNRAAAKIVLNLDFDPDFLEELGENGVEVTGTPAWKFNNFAFGAHVFDPGVPEGVEVHNSDFNIIHNQPFDENKKATIITYTYPNKWEEADYATAAPSLIVSVGYKEGTGESATTTYNYYRVPLVKSTVTSIDRNTIYVINATIATRGSDTHEDVIPIEDIVYNVLPWNDKNNSAAIENNVQSVQHYYFKVNPKVYTLRGDGDQTVILNYMKATGTKVNWKIFTYNANGDQTGVVAKDSEKTNNTATRAWFYDADDKFTINYNDDSGTDWSRTGTTPMGVSIVQSTEGTKGSEGTITVTSTALNNKGIKYIRLRVYLDEQETFDDDNNETMYEDIIIRHFPTDNIQSIEGLWSSYHDPNSSSATTIYKTTNLEEAQALAEQYGITYTTAQITETEVINYATYSAHSTEEGYAMEGPQTRTRQQFRDALTTNSNRQNANGQANAILSDGWYYWGENPSTVNNQNQSDYYTGGWFNTTYYAYQTRYRARYTHTYTYPEYTLELPIASTGNWVDWDASDRTNHTGQRQRNITYGNNNGTFQAKVYNGGTIYSINETSLGGGRYSTTQGSSIGLTNDHMYVIQISSTSDEYILGRPYVNQTTHQSQDNVVSPAFMIASQLGAVTIFTGTNGAANAATHCSRYMEVTPDGIRYTGWRLPTEAEIKVITGYQYGIINNVTIPSNYQVLSPVLTGYRYWALNGTSVLANTGQDHGSETPAYLRCVRDLSAEEVERLNAFDKIQEKYQ